MRFKYIPKRQHQRRMPDIMVDTESNIKYTMDELEFILNELCYDKMKLEAKVMEYEMLFGDLKEMAIKMLMDSQYMKHQK